WSLKKIMLKLRDTTDSERAQIFQLLGSTLKITVVIIGLITALGTMGIDVSAMIAGLGLTGFALGFAFKDALSNLLAGILIIFYQPFSYGDQIRVSACEGSLSR
ncbi:MAG: mechanosensitive ion channel family protein, partial [Calditrichia bacterium]